MRTLADINLDQRDRAAISEAAAALRATLPVQQIVVFGSKVRGTADAESDIDLLILTSRALTAAEGHSVVRTVFPIELRHDVLLSPMVVAAEDWYEGVYQVMPIRKEIDRDGVLA